MNQRSILITGGSAGIGRATALRFAKDGHKVAVTFRTSEPPDGVLGLKCDVSEPDSLDAAFKEAEAVNGPVEVLVCSAGITADQLLMRMTPELIDRVLTTNLTAPILAARLAARKMMIKRFGRIIFVSSAVGMRGEVGQVNYAASKAGLVGAARSIARELGSRGITVNVVSPGLTDTEMLRSTIGSEKAAALAAEVPVPRIGQPEEVAAAIAFLASDEAAYITGAIIPVDGGAGMGH
ncbi:3-oxoacyl-ACP reductase FabG [Dactylosporangium sp. NPDC005572]|uniref:3-oxoacyl-ACP reductase FabG n=1 Tax=Dactylosporangium sp. NPDC005572 TaxID=3156889 RepID=UPI0033AA8CE7